MAKAKKVNVVPAHPLVVEDVAEVKQSQEVIAPPAPVEHPMISSLREQHNNLSPGDKSGQKGKFLQFQFLKATKALRRDVAPLAL